jgi:hypothetical protein
LLTQLLHRNYSNHSIDATLTGNNNCGVVGNYSLHNIRIKQALGAISKQLFAVCKNEYD